MALTRAERGQREKNSTPTDKKTIQIKNRGSVIEVSVYYLSYGRVFSGKQALNHDFTVHNTLRKYI